MKKSKIILILLIGVFIGTCITVSAVTIISAGNVTYSNDKTDKTNVQDVLDDILDNLGNSSGSSCEVRSQYIDATYDSQIVFEEPFDQVPTFFYLGSDATCSTYSEIIRGSKGAFQGCGYFNFNSWRISKDSISIAPTSWNGGNGDYMNWSYVSVSGTMYYGLCE